MKYSTYRAKSASLALAMLASPLWAQTPDPGQAGSQIPQAAVAGAQPTGALAGKAHDGSYVIGDDDVLAVNVWKEPDVSHSVPVRSDGRISLPLVGEVQAAGRTPLQLEQEITARLKDYISEPQVTVMVEQINSRKFNILGQVTKPGTYSLTNGTTVLDAIAAAGGFRDFAKQKGVYILRESNKGGDSRMAFNYKDVIKGKHPEQNIRLQPGDTVVVP